MAISFVDAVGAGSAGATTLTFNPTTTPSEGDVVFIAVTVRGGSGTSIVWDVAFQPIRTNPVVDSTTVLRQAVYKRICGGNEPTSWTCTFSSSQKASGSAIILRGCDLTDPEDVSAGQANASSTTITAPGVNVTASGCWLLGFFGTATATTVDTYDSPLAERTDAASTGGAASGRSTTSGADSNGTISTGATGNKTATAANAAVNIGHLVAVKPQAQTGTTFNASVGASSDDAQANNPGLALVITDTVLSWGERSSATASGMRFTNVTIPNAATINYAYIKARAQATYSAGAAVVIEVDAACQAADNPATFTTAGTNLDTTARPRTTAKTTNWRLHDTLVDIDEIIPITSAVQEVINRAGWASGNALVVIMDDSASNDAEWQDFYAWDHATGPAPAIVINYTSGGSPQTLSFIGAPAAGGGGYPPLTTLFVSPLGAAADTLAGNPVTAPGPVTLSPSGMAGADVAGAPLLASLTPIGPFGELPAAGGAGSASVSPGAVALSPAGLPGADVAGNPTVAPGPVTLVPIGASGGEVAGAVTLAPTTLVGPFGEVPAAGGTGQAVATPGTVTLVPIGAPGSDVAGYPPTVAIGAAGQTLTPAALPAATQAGHPPTVYLPPQNWNLAVGTGTGYTDVSPKQIVRTTANILYAFASDCTAYPCEATTQTIRAYKANQPGVPTSFARQDSADEHSGVAGWAAAIDGDDVVHVIWTYRTATGGTLEGLRYATFDTRTDQWGTATTIISGGLTDSVGQGVQTVALALDDQGVPHIVYLSGNGTARRINYRNRRGGSWSSATQLDSGVTYAGNERAWHPNLAFDATGRIIAAWLRGAFNGDNDGTIFTRIRQTSGIWDTLVNVSGTAAARTTIDQSTSLIITPDNRYHITFIQQPDDYIRYYYSDNAGVSWTANNPGSGTQVTHNPSLGPGDAPGTIRIYGHGTPAVPPDGHGDNLYYFQGAGGGAAWGSWTQFVTSTEYDSSINTRWAQHFWWYRSTLDIAYWDDDYPNDLYTGTFVGGTDIHAANVTNRAAEAGQINVSGSALVVAASGEVARGAAGGASLTPGTAPLLAVGVPAGGGAGGGTIVVPGPVTVTATGVASAYQAGDGALALVISPVGAASVGQAGAITTAVGPVTLTLTGAAASTVAGAVQAIVGLLNQPGSIEIIVTRAGRVEVSLRRAAWIEIITRRQGE